MSKLRSCLILLYCCFTAAGFSQSSRKAIVLNMNKYNLENSNSRYQSTINMMQLAGVPYDTTSFFDTALNYPVLITGSRISDSALSPAQRVQLKNYVSSGGVIITSALRDSLLFDLFGINDSENNNTLISLTWDTSSAPVFDLVNDSLEMVVSIGDTSFTNFYSRVYGLSTGQCLATYEDGSCAVVMNNYGSGKTYLFGPDFRDIVLRCQLNMDLEAQRVYSNGFEVSSDVFTFVVRNIIRESIPNSVYKHTSPGNSSSSLLITHDVDSYSSIDTMHYFSIYEESMGISAQYNVTTRYMSDGWMAAFYPGNEPRVDSLKLHGHILASHSVGHFPDFGEETVFPYGTPGNTMATYAPAYTAGTTFSGTILGELEVSKEILQNSYGVPIRSFRAGHLCYPDSLIMGLGQSGYEFNSTNSANDVLTGFPFFPYNHRSFYGAQNGVLEIPMTISDVFKDNPIADTNASLKVNIWLKDINRYDENNAPVTLLIHPNRMFKLKAMQSLIDSIPPTMVAYPFQQYGEYWRKRDSLQYHTELNNDTLYVHMDNNKLSFSQSFIVDNTGLDAVRFFDYNGTELTFMSQTYSSTQRLYYREQLIIIGTDEYAKEQITFNAYPNPVHEILTIRTESAGLLTIFDLAGKVCYQEKIQAPLHRINFRFISTESGIFFVNLKGINGAATKKVVYIR